MCLDTRRTAERISFKTVPETCPVIDEFLDGIDLSVPMTQDVVENLRVLIKSKTVALREMSFEYIEKSLITQ